MIDPKELRIGNYIQPKEGKDWWGYKFKSIQYIGHDGEFARESDMGQCDVVWNIKDADPIPITAEWLERLGFEKNYDCALSFQTAWVKDSFVLNMNMELCSSVTDDVVWSVPMKYIHQLQNLYFALTGQELTAKP